jgi:Spy/CpxP family protein refolding chaperone
MREMKSIAVLGGLLGIGAIAAFAAAPEGAPRREGRHPMEQRLGLSPEQTGQIQKLRSDFAKVRVKRRADIEVARIELGELMRAPKLDDQAIAAKAKVLGDLQAAQTRERIDHLLAMAKVLTPEQREKASVLLAERHRGGRRGRGGFWRGEQGGFGDGDGPWQGRHGRAPGADNPVPAEQ